MRSFLVTASLCALGLAVICDARAQKVEVEYDETANFLKYATFAWHPDTAVPPPFAIIGTEVLDGFVRTAVERELEKKGFGQQAEGTPDFWVSYTVMGSTEMATQHYDPGNAPWSGGNYGHWRPFFDGEASSMILRRGTVGLEFVDTGTNQLFWRGKAEQVIKKTQPKPADVEKKVNQAVAKLLKRFPKRR
jgi:hypothetical protein